MVCRTVVWQLAVVDVVDAADVMDTIPDQLAMTLILRCVFVVLFRRLFQMFRKLFCSNFIQSDRYEKTNKSYVNTLSDRIRLNDDFP